MQKSAFNAAMAFAALSVFAVGPAAAQSIGHASFYGKELAGRKTASGEKFNPGGLTAAHRSLPFGTQLKLTNISNGRSVVVRINDRGPFVRGRVLDVSLGAAQALGFSARGTAQLRMEALGAMRAKMEAPAAPRTPLDAATPASISSPAASEPVQDQADGTILGDGNIMNAGRTFQN